MKHELNFDKLPLSGPVQKNNQAAFTQCGNKNDHIPLAKNKIKIKVESQYKTYTHYSFR